MLYFRMFITMLVSLYTVRIVLETLGVVDYGIYNVVGSIVTMFSFLSSTMAAASQRFIAFDLGRNDILHLKKTFSITMIIYGIIAIMIIVLAETVGLWFLHNKMDIPADRMGAAIWVYQFSIFTFLTTMLTVPYNAAIIAHENMKVYAWVSIIEVILKLIIVYLLVLFSYDKLKLYSILVFFVTVATTYIYRAYCKKMYSECRFSFYWDKHLFKEIIGYSGWNLFGAFAGVLNNQGVNIVLNLFFGPLVNAARGIAIQVSGVLTQFVSNFVVASRPQITKQYASGNNDQMLRLVYKSSKFSFLLLFIISLPIISETDFIFSLWLKNVPEYVVLFTRLIVISVLVDTFSFPLMAAAQATGKIAKYQAIVGGAMLLNLPVSYVFFIMGFPPPVVFYLAVINSVICLFLRLILLKQMVKMPLRVFTTKVVFPVIPTIIISSGIVMLILSEINYGASRFIISFVTCVITSIVCTFVFSLTRNERAYFIQLIVSYKRKIGI